LKTPNSAMVRLLNRHRLFHTLRENPGSSQRELAALTGLDASTVSNVIREMRSLGFVTNQSREATRSVGRPEVALRLDDSRGVFLGVQLDMHFLTIVLTTLSGVELAYRRLPGDTDLRSALDRVAEAARAVLVAEGMTEDDVLGIGIGAGGLINDQGRLIVNAYQSFRWEGVDLAAELAALLPHPITVMNDAKVAALAEKHFGSAKTLDHFVALNGYAGIGGGIFLDGTTVRGANGLAGEVGHFKVVTGGRTCGCGGRGCLSAYASVTSIMRQLGERGVPVHDTEEVRRLLDSEHPTAIELLEQAGTFIGRVTAAIINFANPRTVIVTGEWAKLAPFFIPAALLEVRECTFHELLPPDPLSISTLGARAVPLGGVALAMEAMLAAPRWQTPTATIGTT
jgi:predicted NBD/HSP70 family sugar kinase